MASMASNMPGHSGHSAEVEEIHGFGYPLVNVYITMEHHHFQWVNHHF